ncbi:hypothetical protein C8J56DRAFT_396992 [Mycena floridula]|nr:hypothetical protein C8J56DRAFT_396992 [Mycena floridula]
MTSFWFTLCDLKIVFDSSDTLKASIKTFLQDVCQTMNDFGNFRDIYYMHGHFARVIRSQTYKTRLTEFAAKFKAHQEKLRDLLTQQTALGVAQIGKNVVEVSKKFDMLLSFMNQRTPFEDRVRQKIEEIGGEDKAIRNTRFLTEIAEKDFNQTLTPQIKTALRTDLNELLQANFAMFELKVQAAQKSIEKSIERSTDTILLHMESGPHNLIDDEDIKTVWKNMKWRISCKARHFVDAVHQHFAHKYSKHRQTTGFAHPEQWTLKFLGRVIFQPTIGDAIDEDGSGYISVHEVNHFFKSRPKKWSSSQWLAFCAVGWYQNNLFYRDRCMDLLKSMETSARNVLPENRKAFKPYMKSGCIPEVWLIVDSLNIVKYRGDDLRQEYEALDPLRFQIMDMEMRQLFSRLQATKYQLDTPEGVSAVMGTTRTEAGVLCLLYLLLERHRKIIELAEKHVLLDREFETMIASVHNVAFTFGMRYHNLTEGWRQQRLDTLLQVQCFSGGIFESWHQHVMEASGAEADIPDPQLYTHSRHNTILDENRDVETPNDLLVFGLPPQPASDSGRRYRTTPKIRVGKEDGLAKERYGRVSQHLRASKSRRLTIDSKRLYAGSPRTPIRRLEEKPWSTGNPRKPSASPAASTHNFFEFDFEGENDGYSSAASSVIPAVHHTKTRTPRMEDRIRAVEKELSTMKDMLAQLLVLSAKAAKT